MAQKGVISFPTPLYSNPPIAPQNYKPNVFTIQAIALGETTIVTTSVNNNYVIGQQIRLLIPSMYGSRGLNELTGFVISIPSSNQVEININSNNIDQFISSPTFLPFQSKTLPQIVAIGDINTGSINTTGRSNTSTMIPGSFIDISPN